MIKIREVIVVEGRYDKAALSRAVDTVILETGGFGIFRRGDMLSLIRRLAEKRGVIVLTDGDGAGFVIRGYLKGTIPGGQLKHAYIPDRPGKERRKRIPSKEGKLGVEGMDPKTLIAALLRAGATIISGDSAGENAGGDAVSQPAEPITKADLYFAGLSGGKDSATRRAALLKQLALPSRLPANALTDVLNALMTREEFLALVGG